MSAKQQSNIYPYCQLILFKLGYSWLYNLYNTLLDPQLDYTTQIESQRGICFNITACTPASLLKCYLILAVYF